MEDVGELRRLVRESYDRGWNEALAAVVKVLRAHPIDWMGDRSFADMAGEQHRLIESLRRPEGGE